MQIPSGWTEIVCPRERYCAPRSNDPSGTLAAEHGRTLSQPNLALILTGGILHDLVAGADWASKNGSRLAKMHLTLIGGRGVLHNLVARANGTEDRGGFSQVDLVLVVGGGITGHFIACVNGGSVVA